VSTEQYKRIEDEILPVVMERFRNKTAEYGNGAANDLGIRGQYSDMHRKMIKLRRAMWDGEVLTSEPLEEVIGDMIAHCLLTLDMLAQDKFPKRCPWIKGDLDDDHLEDERRCTLWVDDGHDHHMNLLGDIWPVRL
jgi:hypothetical protein